MDNIKSITIDISNIKIEITSSASHLYDICLSDKQEEWPGVLGRILIHQTEQSAVSFDDFVLEQNWAGRRAISALIAGGVIANSQFWCTFDEHQTIILVMINELGEQWRSHDSIIR